MCWFSDGIILKLKVGLQFQLEEEKLKSWNLRQSNVERKCEYFFEGRLSWDFKSCMVMSVGHLSPTVECLRKTVEKLRDSIQIGIWRLRIWYVHMPWGKMRIVWMVEKLHDHPWASLPPPCAPFQIAIWKPLFLGQFPC